MKFPVTAFVPVKGESSRLPGKNWLEFSGTSLLQHKIRQLQRISGIDRVIVSSEADFLLEMAENEGAEAIKRPPSLADESRPISEFVHYSADLVGSGSLLWACVTSPTLRDTTVQDVVSSYPGQIERGFDSVITVMDFKHFVMDESGALNFSVGVQHQNSQELPDWSLFTNGLTLAPVDKMKEWSERFGPRAYRHKVALLESVDIDTAEDYELALAIDLWERTGRKNP